MSSIWIPEEQRKTVDELLDRIEAMRETLDDEHGVELVHFGEEFNRELAPYALYLGLALLDARRPKKREPVETFDFPPRGKM